MMITTNRTPTWRAWVAGARPRTLPAAIVPVSVGAAASVGGGVVWWRVAAALAVSLLLQIGVNYANDYSDGVRGTDDERVGPMRLVATGTASPGAVKRAALVAFGAAALVGLALAAATTWWLVAVGVAAIAAAWGYTGGPKPYGYLGLGELFVFVFFGLVATVGTTYVAIGQIPSVAWVAAIGVGLLAVALLLINNLRDIPTDAVAGKHTLAVRFGDRWARRLYVGSIVLAFVAAIGCAWWRPWAVLTIAAVAVAQRPIRAVLGGASGSGLVPVLGSTGRTQMAYGVLLSIGLAIS